MKGEEKGKPHDYSDLGGKCFGCGLTRKWHNQLVSDDPSYELTYTEGQQIAEVLRRYVDELLEQKRQIMLYDSDPEGDSREVRKDIEYVTGLANLFG